MDVDHQHDTEKTADGSARPRARNTSPPTRHSPARPLAPLEYLQNQRRGSITDPSLHAAGQNQPLNAGSGSPSTTARQSELPATESNRDHANSTPPASLLRLPSLSNRSNSPLTFGDAPAHPVERTSQTRRSARLHADTSNSGVSSHGSQRLHDGLSVMAAAEQNPSAGRRDEMDTGPDAFVPGYNEDSNPSSDHSSFDHRRSYAAESGRMNRGSDSSPFGQTRSTASQRAGAKRKASGDRDIPPGEEIDPQLAGPGIHTLAPIDTEAPAAKRRGSAVDARISQLSLYDRRNSVDSRAGGASSWWAGERRDSSSSMFSNAGYSSPAFSGDSRPSGSMPTFAWPPAGAAGDSAAAMQPAVDPNLMRTFEGSIPPQSLVSQGPPFDRRMSVPDMVPSHSVMRSERVFRSRSRPPSRANAGNSRTNGPSTSLDSAHTGGNTGSDKQEEPPSATSSNGSHTQGGQSESKGNNSTPYSRSPELRVSHKLAERKRRKEMKDLFDELRDQLPADRGMKASKWEILSKAIDFIQTIKQNQSDMMREIEVLRHELDAVRHSGLAFGHPPPGSYAQPPPVTQYPPPPSGLPAHAHGQQSRPGSSHNSYPPLPHSPSANGKS